MVKDEEKKEKRKQLVVEIASISLKLINDSYNFSDKDIIDIIKALLYEKIDTNENLFPDRDKSKEKIDRVAQEILELAKSQMEKNKNEGR